MSPAHDWREDDPARISDDLDLGGYAFEFLRRNPDYVRDYRQLGQCDDSTRRKEGPGIARQWGLRFRP